MFKKFLALSVLSVCATISSAEREPWPNPSGKIKISGINLEQLNISRDPKLKKSFIITSAAVGIAQEEAFGRNCTNITFYPTYEDDRTIIVPTKTVVIHIASNDTKTTFKAKKTHISDKEIEKEKREKRYKEEAAAAILAQIKQREAAAVAAALAEAELAQAEQRPENRLKRRIEIVRHSHKRRSGEFPRVTSLLDESNLDNFTKEDFPIMFSNKPIKFSPTKS